MAIITISRGTFSGGRTLAECLAKRLGYQCLSREVILDAAKEYGISAEKLSAAMERTPSLWQQLKGERTDYLNFVRAALCDRAREGDLIYHGHAGHLLLTGISHVIRVRVIGDMEYRISAAMRQLELEREAAIAHIEKVDKERDRWTRFLYGVDWRDPSLYDVVLNLNRISIPSACETLAAMTELEEFRPTAQSLRAAEDLALSTRVTARLLRDPRTEAANLQVVADDGTVTIAGATRSWAVVEAIPAVALQVEGVREVVCQVGIGPASESSRQS